ncbi:ArnT family glycosyltransferase [Ostreiculturibacter nitratireducens]|uniref:ArnT family glycosyltransferase n=1 Tax=Ostreiculturibacter nitratireducens TaxID=3075226 RepID=UPI0031B6300F
MSLPETEHKLATHVSAGQCVCGSPALWAGVVVFGTLILGLWTLWEPLGLDQGIHATIGFALDQGLLPYRDVYNIKPPMTTVTHWLSQALFGHSFVAIRCFDLLAVLATAFGVRAVSGRLGLSRPAAALAGLLFASFYYGLTFWEHAQTDGWAGFLVVAAILALLRGWGEGRGGWFFLAGALLGLAFGFKYTIAGTGLLIFAPLLARDPAYLFSWRGFLFFVAGGIAALAAIFSAMAAAGILADFLEIQRYILGYITIEGESLPLPHLRIVLALARNTLPFLLFLIGLVTLPFTGHVRRFGLVVLAIWLGTCALSGIAQGKGFEYHYLPILPPAGIIAASGLRAILSRLPSEIRTLRFVPLLLAAGLAFSTEAPRRSVATVFMLARGEDPVPRWEKDFPLDHYNFSDMRQLSATLDELRAPDETLFLWGYDTGIYLLQRTPPRHRYPYSWPLVVNFHDGRYTQDLLDRLRSSPPDIILVQKQDEVPLVTGHRLDSREMLDAFPELKSFLTGRYRLLRTLSRYDIWRLDQG